MDDGIVEFLSEVVWRTIVQILIAIGAQGSCYLIGFYPRLFFALFLIGAAAFVLSAF